MRGRIDIEHTRDYRKRSPANRETFATIDKRGPGSRSRGGYHGMERYIEVNVGVVARQGFDVRPHPTDR